MFGQILTMSVKEKLIKNMTKFQLAGKPGHRPTEHLYVVLSLIAMAERKKEPLILALYDLKKYYDCENIEDCMNEIYKSGVKNKPYRLLFKMNENISIRVQTPVGTTEEENVGNIVGQGTNEGNIISSVSINGGVREKFHEDGKKGLLHLSEGNILMTGRKYLTYRTTSRVRKIP